MQQKTVRSLWYFTIFILAAMLLPRLVVQGLFGDGLLYSSMARNMAIGKGSIWQPFFSSGYWIENIKPIYYENPPLMLWLQSFFFRWFGDFWWVEKFYSFCLFLVNAFLLVKIWHLFEKKYTLIAGLGCVVLFFWSIMPRVIWGNPNNMMDNQMLTFCLLAIWLIFKGLSSKTMTSLLIYNSLAGVSVFLGVLAKGPVAVYPLAIPFLWAVFTKEISLKKGFLLSAYITIMTLVFFASLLWQNQAAYSFFENYWQQRLQAVIVGSRTDMALIGWERFETLQYLAVELLPMVILFLLGYVFLKIKRISVHSNKKYNQIAWFFVAVGFSATLPIMISTKQSAVYLLPGLPMFAFAGSFFVVSFLEKMLAFSTQKFVTRLLYFSYLGVFVTLVYTFTEIGKVGREKALAHDIIELKKIIPANERIGVCPEMMEDFTYHTNLQRFGYFELQSSDTTRFFLAKKTPADSLQNIIPNNYRNVPFKNEILVLYERNE